ncbi:MAG: hypothetical protein WCJ58_08585 [bacterium]
MNRINRSKQFIMPLVALIYGIIMVILIEKINQFSNYLIDSLTNTFESLKALNLEVWLINLTNVLILLGFIFIKLFVISILNTTKRNSRIHEAIGGIYYKFSEKYDAWFIKEKWETIKTYIKGFYIGAIITSILILIFSREFSNLPIFKFPIYPVFGILLLGEFVFFLGGFTLTEFLEDILGEHDECERISNYSLLRKIFRGMFPERILFDETIDGTLIATNATDFIDKMSNSESKKIRTIGNYFQQCRDSGEIIEEKFISSTIDLLSGKSVIFYTPFYADISSYLFFPILKQLMSHNKILVVSGRSGIENDLKDWINDGLFKILNISSLWKAEIMDSTKKDYDIAVLPFSELFNIDLINHCEDFLSEVGFVIIIEPSKILAAGQIGLNLLVNKCELYSKDKSKKIVYCACDRNADGLVDALSHSVKTSIVEVSAASVAKCEFSEMLWKAEGLDMHHIVLPNITRYLGVGTEIAVSALKNQVDNVTWVSSEKFPVIDMRWFVGQYYKTVCRAANLPVTQESIDEHFEFKNNIWGTKVKQNHFLIVEDEFRNLFEMARIFSTRAIEQGFVNVISENYLLRDYMQYNSDLFLTDPKAIPTIVPDFARTERNTTLKLIMLMANSPISEDEIRKELIVINKNNPDTLNILKDLIRKHCGISKLKIENSEELQIEEEFIKISHRDTFDEEGLEMTTKKYFSLDNEAKFSEYIKALKNAYYIAEDQEGERHYVGSKLYGHVYQSFLPGQFFTFAGKFYEILTITEHNGVLVRRAADHMNGRKYYRQLRNLNVSNMVADTNMASFKTISDIIIEHYFGDINIQTDGYIELDSPNNHKSAKVVKLNAIPDRNYKKKSILKITLPGTTEEDRYLICTMLNEIFETTYPDTCDYISALFVQTDKTSEMLNGFNYKMTGPEPDDCIYIVEDSEIDLGLIVSVERNIQRFFEIITDFLVWHTKMLAEVLVEKPDKVEVVVDFIPQVVQKKKGILESVKRIISNIGEFFKGIFGKFKKKPKDIPIEVDDEPKSAIGEETVEGSEVTSVIDEAQIPEEPGGPEESEVQVDSQENEEPEAQEESQENEEPEAQEESQENEEPEAQEESQETEETEAQEEPEELDVPQEAQTIDTEVTEEETVENETEPIPEPIIQKTPYQTSHYLQFGYAEESPSFAIESVIEYFKKFEFDSSSLRQARDNIDVAGLIEGNYEPNKPGAHYCDFCRIELTRVEYDLLKDGRERCAQCTRTVVKSNEEFNALFKSTIRKFEALYGVKLNIAIKVRMVNAKVIAKHTKQKFEATEGFDPRVLGFAKKDKYGFCIFVENGSPRMCVIATLAHELTHIWQFLNWNDASINSIYGASNKLIIYEGMAKWVEVQYLMLIGEKAYAKREEISLRSRQDEYGYGFLKYVEAYQLSKGTLIEKTTPFENKTRPL